MSDLITVGAAARILGCSSEYVRRLCNNKTLPSIRAKRGHRMIPAHAVLERANGNESRLCANCRIELAATTLTVPPPGPDREVRRY